MEDIEKLVLKVRYKADQQRFGNYPTVTLSVGTVYALCDESASLLAENERLRSNCYPRDGVEAIIQERDAYKAQLSESQRRERAATEDISAVAYHERKMPCIVCTRKNAFGDELRKHCQNCNQFNSHFEWRGPMAGEGEAE